jgi:hypothetical protein
MLRRYLRTNYDLTTEQYRACASRGRTCARAAADPCQCA